MQPILAADMATDTETTDNSKIAFTASRHEVAIMAVYLLSLSLFGLDFYPALLVTVVMLVKSFRTDRHEFIVQLTLLLGCYALTDRNRNFPFKPSDAALALSFICMVIHRKRGAIGKITTATILYLAIIAALALTSNERMSIQILRMREYAAVIYLYVPLVIFADRRFDILRMFRIVILYSSGLAVFYIVDGFILNGFILIPNSMNYGGSSSFYDPWWRPFTFEFVRKYPPGLYLLALAIYPAVMIYRLRWWLWVVISIALAACRTMTFIAGLAAGAVLSGRKIGRTVRYATSGALLFAGIYSVDQITGGFLRVAPTVNQFTAFTMPEEQTDGLQDENFVSFATGRLEQIIPKFQLLFESGRQWIGLGFLHPEKTHNPDFIIDNPYYSDISRAEEVATGVEVTQLQTILDIGFVGFAIQTAYFLFLYLLIRRLKYSWWYAVTAIAFTVAGLGGFAGLNSPESLYLIAVSLSSVILFNRNKQIESCG